MCIYTYLSSRYLLTEIETDTDTDTDTDRHRHSHHTTMVTTTLFSALLALTAAGPARAANLLVSHYSGFIYSLSLTPSNGTVPASLALTSTLQGGGQTPSWLTLDAASSSLFVSDESELATPDPVLSNLQVNADNSVQVVANATGSPGQVHSTLYGGADGKGFIALAQ